MKVEIYSDIACPWCYIGKRRFEQALAAHPLAEEMDVVFRPFQLDPAAPAKGAPLLEYLARKFGAAAEQVAGHVAGVAAGEGIAMDFDAALAANTLAAHRLLHLAEREHGRDAQHALAERLFQAHFSRGLDVGDGEVLAELAADAGMDAGRAREFLESGEGTAEVEAEIEAARRRGVTAVPTFVFDGRYRVEGAQPASTFTQVLARLDGTAGGADG